MWQIPFHLTSAGLLKHCQVDLTSVTWNDVCPLKWNSLLKGKENTFFASNSVSVVVITCLFPLSWFNAVFRLIMVNLNFSHMISVSSSVHGFPGGFAERARFRHIAMRNAKTWKGIEIAITGVTQRKLPQSTESCSHLWKKNYGEELVSHELCPLNKYELTKW